MTKKLMFALLLAFSLLVATIGYAATSDIEDEIIYNQTLKQIYGNDFEAPFLSSTQSETVDESSGALHIKQTDLSLNGRNGLDLNIMRRFNSQKTDKVITNFSSGKIYHRSNMLKYKYSFYNPKTKSTDECYVAFQTEADMIANAYDSFYAEPYLDSSGYKNWDYNTSYGFYSYYSIVDNSDDPDRTLLTRIKTEPVVVSRYEYDSADYDYFATKTNASIGYNWELVIPHMKTELKYNTQATAAQINYNVGEFQTDTGEVYSYRYIYDSLETADPETGSHTDFNVGYIKSVDNYTFNVADNTLAVYKDTEKGISYVFYITDKYGKTFYFNRDGKIQAVEDRYGNIIKYVWNSETSLQITDTYGRVINVDLTSENASVTVTDGIEKRVVRYPCTETAEVEYPVDSEKTYIFKVENESYENDVLIENYTTEYKMSKKEILPVVDYSNVYEARMYSYNLDEIVYPTGYTTKYTYEDSEKYYHYATQSFKRASGVVHAVKTKKEYDGSLCSQTEYTYDKFQSYDSKYGYVDTILQGMDSDSRISKYGKTVDGEKVGDNINYSTTVVHKNNSGSTVLTDVITYDVWDRKKSLLRTGSNYKYEELYEYDNTLNIVEEMVPLSKLTQKQYNGTTAYPLETTWTYDDKLNMTSETVGEKSTTYTYSPDYNIMLSQKYHRDADNEVETINELTEDKKSVARQYVKENNTDKNKGTYYTYNSYGETTGVKTYTSDTEYINQTIAYDYDSADKEFTITTTTEDVTNADGVETDVVNVQVLDYFGNPVSTTDANNNTTTFEYDGFGRMTKQINPDNTFGTVSYDITNNIITTNENNQTMRYTYNKRGLLVEAAVKDGDNWVVLETNEYDAFGRKTKYTQNRESDKVYNAVYTYDAIGRTLTETINDATTNTSQARYSYSYAVSSDSNSRPLTTVTTTVTKDSYITPEKAVQKYDYRNLLTYKKDLTGITTSYEYDYIGNLLVEKDVNSTSKKMKYTYDYMGNVLKQTNAKNAVASFTYDQAGRLLTKTDYNKKATNFTYDELGRTIITTLPFENDVTSQTKQYYDNNGNVLKTMQQSNAVGSATTWDTTEYSYDSRNRLLWTKTIPDSDTNNYVQYKYDNVGNVTKVFTGLTALIDVNSTEIPKGCAVTSYEYDLLNRVTSIIDPYQKAETFTYDNAGNVLTKTDRNGTVTTTTYNAFNQPLSVTAVNGTDKLTTTYTYDTMGNVRSAVQGGQSITYGYNNYSQLTSEQYGNAKVEYTYTSDNRNIATMKVYNGTDLLQDLSYTYDSLDLLTKVTGEKITTYQYDYNGRLVREITDDKKSVDYEYNDMGLIKYVYNTYEDNHYWDYEYTYYLNGNRKTETHRETTLYRETDTETERTKNYVYDGMGRVKGVIEGSDITGYLYDVRGNISMKASQSAENYSETYQYDLNNRLLKTIKTEGQTTNENLYYYDANGNMIYMINNTIAPSSENADAEISTESDRLRVNSYDLNNRLVSTQFGGKTTTYTYDPTGMRRAKNVDGTVTNFIIDRGNVVAELNGDNTLKASYERGHNLLCRVNSSGVVDMYYEHNGHGDVTQVIDATGMSIKQYDFDVYGNEINSDSTDTNPFRYCGEYYDAETGYIYLRNRYYDPSVGSFITEDPIRDGLNWYAYCGGNPVNRIDSWGLDHYIIYGEDQIERAEVAEKNLLEEDPDTPVHMIYIESPDDFYNAWENMGKDENGQNIQIDTVIISLHGTDYCILGENESEIYVNNLGIKNIDTIVLTACNTGNMNYKDNVASQLAMSQNVNQVLAPDGLGYFVNDSHVGSVYDSYYGNVVREGNGYVLYENIGGTLTIIPGVNKDSSYITINEYISRGRFLGSLTRGLKNYFNVNPATESLLSIYKEMMENY